MNELEKLDVSNIHVWQMSLKTIDSEIFDCDGRIDALQQCCVARNLISLGFAGKRIAEQMDDMMEFDLIERYRQSNHSFVREANDLLKEGRNIQRYLEVYGNGSKINSALLRALSNWHDIKAGDFIVMRLRDSKYYIGKVLKGSDGSAHKYYVGGQDNPKSFPTYTEYLINKDMWKYKSEDYQTNCSSNDYPLNYNLSWAVDVEKWISFSEESIPAEISGIFSHRTQGTIKPIRNVRLRCLIKKLYEGEDSEIPRINLTRYNFASSLNYAELEDLVAIYIHEKNPDYRLLPSSGKISRMKYEFSFINTDSPQNIITCQVKNHALIDPLDYIKDSYSKIYLFSGIWDEKKEKEKVNQYPQIILISSDELFNLMEKVENVFLNNKIYNINKESKYENENIYPFDVSRMLVDLSKSNESTCIKEWNAGNLYIGFENNKLVLKKRKRKKQNSQTETNEDDNTNDDNNLIINNLWFGNNIFYSTEFNRLILDGSWSKEEFDQVYNLIKTHMYQ